MPRTSWSTTLATVFLLLPLLCPGLCHSQDWSFEFRVTFGDETSAWCVFGLCRGASAGLDAWDVPAPPAAPGASLRVYLTMEEPPGGLPNCWWGDFRDTDNAMSALGQLWRAQLDAPMGAVCHVDVRAQTIGSAPHDLVFFGPGTAQVTLELPASVSFTVESAATPLFFELRFGGGVATDATTWGSVLALFR